MAPSTQVREQLARLLSWSDAHASADDALRDMPPRLRGTRPPGLPHSPWELLEHIRIAQRDILDFCVAAEYRELKWPEEYWPPTAEPPTPEAWEESVARFRDDREELERLARDKARDLTAITPHGSDQSYLREILLTADHTAYHVGQLVLVRRLLGSWPPG